MGGLEDPVCILRVRDQLVVPFDLQMSWCLLEEGWTGEIVDVELRRHSNGTVVEAELQRSLNLKVFDLWDWWNRHIEYSISRDDPASAAPTEPPMLIIISSCFPQADSTSSIFEYTQTSLLYFQIQLDLVSANLSRCLQITGMPPSLRCFFIWPLHCSHFVLMYSNT